MESEGCKYDIPWVGKCGEPTLGGEYCRQHKDRICSVKSCDKKATRGCPSASSLVCGYPLCDDHKHKDHI